MRQRFSLLLLASLFLPIAVHSQSSWRPLDGPVGATTYRFMPIDAAHALAVTDRGVVLTSDEGATWRPVVGLAPVRTPLYRDGAALFAVQTLSLGAEGSTHRLLQSTDGGETFEPVATSLEEPGRTVRGAVVDSATGDVIVGGTGLWRVPAGGGAPTQLVATFVQRLGRAGGDVVYTDSAGLFRLSLAPGAAPVSLTMPEDAVRTTLGVAPTGEIYLRDNRYHLHRSTDGGLTWARLTDVSPQVHASMSFTATGEAIVHDIPGQAFRSTDRGATWTQLSGNAVGRFQFIDLAPDGTLGASVIGPDKLGRTVRSTDGGTTWTDVPFANPAWSIVALAGRPGSPLLAVTGDLLFRSTDGGDSWSLSELTRNAAPNRLLSMAPDGTLFEIAPLSSGLHRSTDGGVTWTEIDPDWTQDLRSMVAIDRSHVAALDGNGSARLYDADSARWRHINASRVMPALDSTGGILTATARQVLRWPGLTMPGRGSTVVGGDLPFESPSELVVAPNGTLVVLSNDRRRTARLTPGTTEWIAGDSLPVGAVATSIAFSPNGILYLGTSGSVYRSRDEGATWQRDDAAFLSVVRAIAFGSDGDVFAGTSFPGTGIHATSDLPSGIDGDDGARRDPRASAARIDAVAPNPARSSVAVGLTLERAGRVTAELVTTLGERVATLLDERRASGPTSLRLDLAGIAAGTYLLRVGVDGASTSRTVVVE